MSENNDCDIDLCSMSATLSRLPPSYHTEPMDIDAPVSRAKSVSTLYAPRRGSDAIDYEPVEVESRLRPRLGLSATMDRYKRHTTYTENRTLICDVLSRNHL